MGSDTLNCWGGSWDNGTLHSTYNTIVGGTYASAIIDNFKNYNYNNKETMKEEKLELQKVTFVETKVIEYTYEIMAANLEDAKEKIEKGGGVYETKLISKETKIK